jgi:hypothetical protein
VFIQLSLGLHQLVDSRRAQVQPAVGEWVPGHYKGRPVPSFDPRPTITS